MKRKQLIQQLKASKDLKAECPFCGEEFAVANALLFDAAGEFPQEAREYLERKQEEQLGAKEELKNQGKELARRKHAATHGAEKKAMEVTLGFVVEKLVPYWKGFPYQPHDCRHLSEPIDYLAFAGMTVGQVEKLSFLDIKTANAQLNRHQRLIRDAIKGKRLDYKEL